MQRFLKLYHFNKPLQCLSAAMLIWLLLFPAAQAQNANQASNQVPNPEFRGNQGAVAGNVTGAVPSAWRGFAVGSSSIQLDTQALSAGELFSGSPETNSVRLETTEFGAVGSDNGFDHNAADFSLFEDRMYTGEVYLRSANADNSTQQVSVSVPIFDQSGVFTGNQPGSFNATAGSNWTRFSGPAFAGIDGFSALLAFRLLDDGGDNAVWIALPQVDGPVLANRLPNPDFIGSNGLIDGNVSGDVPDDWRAFAIEGASLDIEISVLSENSVFPGSPDSNAVAISAVNGSGFTGFDHEPVQVPLTPAGYRFRPQVYMRSANNDNSMQDVVVNTPVFDNTGFTGRTPGIFAATVDNQWRLYIGPTFSELPGSTTNLAIAVVADGGEDSIQIAFPTLRGVDLILADGFE